MCVCVCVCVCVRSCMCIYHLLSIGGQASTSCKQTQATAGHKKQPGVCMFVCVCVCVHYLFDGVFLQE